MSLPQEMNAVTIGRFGGADLLTPGLRPLPKVEAGEVLIQVAYAGVGTWDPLEREGFFAEMLGQQPAFPVTLGTDGSGTIAAVGADVERFQVGDVVYALAPQTQKHGFYAEYVAIDADTVSLLPGGIPLDQAGAMPAAALTAFQGLDDTLRLTSGEALLILGASGDLGHLAVQMAKRMGARVLAVASGDDGAALVRELGADVAIDGKTADIEAAARDFAPAGLDAVLGLVGGPSLDAAIAALGDHGRIAHPLGVQPEPEPREGLDLRPYTMTPDAAALVKLNEMIASGPFTVRIARVFPLDQAMAAQQALGRPRIGKLILQVAPPPS